VRKKDREKGVQKRGRKGGKCRREGEKEKKKEGKRERKKEQRGMRNRAENMRDFKGDRKQVISETFFSSSLLACRMVDRKVRKVYNERT